MTELPTLEELKNKGLKKPAIKNERIKKESHQTKKISIKKEKPKINREKLVNEVNKMVKEKKATPRSKSALDRVRQTEADYQSIMGENLPNTRSDDGTLQENIDNEIMKRLNEEVPKYVTKMIKEGKIDPKLLTPQANIDQPITTDPITTILGGYANRPHNNGGNKLDDMKTIIEILKLTNQQQQPKNNSSNDLIRMFGEIMKNQTEQSKIQREHDRETNEMRYQMFRTEMANLIPRENPRENLLRDLEFAEKIRGDVRQMSKDELEYRLKQQELMMKQDERKDMLAMEEREKDREVAKSDRIMEIAGVALEKLMGQGLGSLIGDIASNVGKKAKKQLDNNEDKFDPSLLDAL